MGFDIDFTVYSAAADVDGRSLSFSARSILQVLRSAHQHYRHQQQQLVAYLTNQKKRARSEPNQLLRRQK